MEIESVLYVVNCSCVGVVMGVVVLICILRRLLDSSICDNYRSLDSPSQIPRNLPSLRFSDFIERVRPYLCPIFDSCADASYYVSITLEIQRSKYSICIEYGSYWQRSLPCSCSWATDLKNQHCYVVLHC